MNIAARTWMAVLTPFVLILCGGCSVPSLNTLATPETTIFESSVVGDWVQQSKSDDALRIRVAKGEGNLYDLVLNPEEAREGEAHKKADGPRNLKLAGALVKLGDHRFIDLTLSGDARKALGDQYALLTIPVHQVFKISIEKDRLTVWDLDDAWIKELLERNPAAIEHSMVDGDSPVITAPTPALQKFIAAHASEEKAWADAQVYTRAKAAAPPKPQLLCHPGHLAQEGVKLGRHHHDAQA